MEQKTHVASKDQLADMFTKALGKVKFIELRTRIELHYFAAEMQVQWGDWRVFDPVSLRWEVAKLDVTMKEENPVITASF